MADHTTQFRLTNPRHSKEAVVHRELDFSHNMKPMAEQKVVIAVNTTSQRVLHGKDGTICKPELDSLEGSFELVTGDRLAVRVGFTGGSFTVSTGDALISDAEGRTMHGGRREVRYGERSGKVSIFRDDRVDTIERADVNQVKGRAFFFTELGGDLAIDGSTHTFPIVTTGVIVGRIREGSRPRRGSVGGCMNGHGYGGGRRMEN